MYELNAIIKKIEENINCDAFVGSFYSAIHRCAIRII